MPCSVKARGFFRVPPQFDVTFCDIKFAVTFGRRMPPPLDVPKWNIKFLNS